MARTKRAWQSLHLRATAGSIAALVLLPALALLLAPRPRAQGLERLLSQVALIQSFPFQGRLGAPPLWQQRLGPSLAGQVWNRQHLWWQFWAEHGDGAAYLAFPWASLPDQSRRVLPANSIRVDDLLVIAPDPLSQRLLRDELQLKQRQSQGLLQRCRQRLEQDQAVYWSPAGLGALVGPVAPLLQHVQQGCLSLGLRGETLLLSGEASATQGYSGGAQGGNTQPPLAPLGPSVVLELRGPELDPLLEGLLSRQLIRDPLAARYGIAQPQLALIRQTPFLLRLNRFKKGPFQAGLELRLAVGSNHRQWASLLQGLRPALIAQGLVDGGPSLQSPGGAIGSARFPAAQWSREDGQVVGGWRWLRVPGEDPQVVLFLGPDPSSARGIAGLKAEGGAGTDWARAGDRLLRLRLRPKDLAGLGLLPPDLPKPVRMASQLAIDASIKRRDPLSQLGGSLQWGRFR
uniref:hypothetical protein n=1 Tax=Cyanobium sp. TaxID=2164130 RepID=UPI004048D51A